MQKMQSVVFSFGTCAHWELKIKIKLQELSAGAIEYADCISAEGVRSPSSHNEYPCYDIKPSDGEAQIFERWGMWSTP